MALWLQNEKKKQKMEDYFSSINSMTMRIMEERNKVMKHYKGCWENLSCDEQDKKIDEWFTSPALKKKYSKDPDSDQKVKVFPTLKMNTGQNIQILDSEVHPASWRDEHSDPFCCETKSQMDLRLPASVSSSEAKKQSPPSSLDRSSDKTCLQEEIHEPTFSSSSEIDYFSTERSNSKKKGSPNLPSQAPDQPSPLNGVTKHPTAEITSFNIDDLTITRCDLDEGYLDRKKAAGSDFEKSRSDYYGGKRVIIDAGKPGGLSSQSKNPNSQDNQSSKIRISKNSPKSHYKNSTPSVPMGRLGPAERVEKQSIMCQKIVRQNVPNSKSPPTPHSSLTLDGAIYNLEVAMRQTSQTSNSDKDVINAEDLDLEFDFNDFGKTNGRAESDYKFKSALNEEQSPISDPSDTGVTSDSAGTSNHLTGFDFLDNW